MCRQVGDRATLECAALSEFIIDIFRYRDGNTSRLAKCGSTHCQAK